MGIRFLSQRWCKIGLSLTNSSKTEITGKLEDHTDAKGKQLGVFVTWTCLIWLKFMVGILWLMEDKIVSWLTNLTILWTQMSYFVLPGEYTYRNTCHWKKIVSQKWTLNLLQRLHLQTSSEKKTDKTGTIIFSFQKQELIKYFCIWSSVYDFQPLFIYFSVI